MAVKEFSGKTIDEAKAAAAAELGISADELVYDVVAVSSVSSRPARLR